jgi:CBS domain-containing protein
MVCAEDFMTKEVATIAHDKTVLDAAKLMSELGVGSLVVTQDGRPAGIVTDRDLVTKVLAKGMDVGKVKVGEIMSKPLATVSRNTPMLDIARLLDERKIRRVPVVDGDKIVGIVTSSDMGRAAKILAPYLLPRIPEIYLVPKKPE